MKPRNPEAARLEEDYLTRVRAALAGRPEAEIADVVQSVREHIEESAAALEGGEITLSEMAAIIERLGPPQAYTEEPSQASLSSPPAPQLPSGAPATAAAVAVGAIDYVNKPFEFGSCVSDALNLYTLNFLPLLMASIVFYLFSACTLGILAGPLQGGMALMTWRAVHRQDHKVDFGDLFGMFGRFWPLLGLFFTQVVCIAAGMVCCMVPGILLTAVWSLATLCLIDLGTGVFDSLRESYGITTAPGRFGTNLLLALAAMAMSYIAGAVPHIGFVISCVAAPLVFCMTTLAYARQKQSLIPIPLKYRAEPDKLATNEHK